MLQRDGVTFSVRIGTTGGRFTAAELRDTANLCERFGHGEVHITTRQAVEIHHVPENRIDEFISAYEATALTPARSGTRVRTVVACPGNKVCKFAGIDSQLMAHEIERRFGDIAILPSKIKIAVAGCKNCCTRANYNDIGIIGAGKNRYELFVGGHGGRTQQAGKSCGIYDSPEKLFDAINDLIRKYASEAAPKQRIGQWLNAETKS